MNRAELQARLAAANISTHAYSLEGDCEEESYCLENVDGWRVYYSERGLRTGERVFPTEEEACDHLFGLLIGDPTTRRSVAGWPDHDPIPRAPLE